MTLLDAAPLTAPMVVDDRTILEAGSPMVWFTFPGAHHDIARCHRADGTFTGLYADVLLPVDFRGDDWHITDLFLDVLVEPGRPPRLLDEAELVEAVARGWVDRATARAAEAEAARLMDEARSGRWPPPVVEEWTLTRARAAARGHTAGGAGVSPPTGPIEPESL